MKRQRKNVKVTLQRYYKTLPRLTQPKTKFLDEVVRRCGVTKQAAQRWTLQGVMPSSKEHCDIIADIIGLPAQELFPLYNEKFNTNENPA